jgi:hypothetical protein
MTVNKVDVVILDLCKKFRLDFETYISNNESQVFISILVNLVCFLSLLATFSLSETI